MTKAKTQKKHLQKSSKNKKLFRKRILNTKSEKPRKISSNGNISFLNSITTQKNKLNLSLINWIKIFIKNRPEFAKKSDEFILKVISIIRYLEMNKNEFIAWTLLVEYFLKNFKYNINIESLFYIAILSKEKFHPNFLENINKENIDINKFNEIKNILEPRKISIIELNQKFKNFCNLSSNMEQQKNKQILNIYNYNAMADYIVKINKQKEIKKAEKNQNKKKLTKANEHSIKVSYNVEDIAHWDIKDMNKNINVEQENENDGKNNFNENECNIIEKNNENENSEKSILNNSQNIINNNGKEEEENIFDPIIGFGKYDSDNDNSLKMIDFDNKLFLSDNNNDNKNVPDFNFFNSF